MIEHSHGKYGVKYCNYVSDGEAKIYKNIIEAQKLPKLLKNTIEDKEIKVKTTTKSFHKRSVTTKFIDKLTVYYELFIRSNSNSIKKIKEAI